SSSERRADEYPDCQSSLQHVCFLGRRQDLCLPKTRGSETAVSLAADPSAARISAPRTHVSNTGCHLCRNTSSICVSSSFRRPARRRARASRDSCFGEKLPGRSTRGVGFQCGRNAGPAECYHSGHHLSGATVHGSSLLDSGILGSCVVGDALPHVRVPLEVLEERSN